MLEFVETRRDISLEDPVIVPGPEGVNLSDRVLSTTSGTETVTNRFEVRLEHRLQHQHQGCLHHPIHRGRDTKASQFATARLGDQTLPHRQWSKRAGLQLLPHLLQKLDNLSTLGDRCRAHPVHSGGPRTLVPCHPFPRDGEKVRVVDKVKHIIKAAAGIPDRPLVQLALHLSYPPRRPNRVRPQRFTDIHQRLRSCCAHCVNPLGPFAMYEAFPRSDYYGPSAPPCGHRQTTRQPGHHPSVDADGGAGASRRFPRSLHTDQQVRCPAMPLRYRHGYAAGIHRGLRGQRP